MIYTTELKSSPECKKDLKSIVASPTFEPSVLLMKLHQDPNLDSYKCGSASKRM
jgi:hypothetical protein